MKLILEVSELEKKEILEKHEFFKQVLKTKTDNKVVNEQTTPTSGGGVEFLKAARDKGCKIAVGGVLKSAPGKPTILYKKADYDSKNGYFKTGDELYIKDDFTFDVITTDENGQKKLAYSNRKWTCPALTQPIEQQVKQNIDRTKLEGNWKTKEELIKDGDTEQNIENDSLYEKKVVNGTTLYRRKASSSIGASLTPDQQAIINKWTAQGAKLRKDLDAEQADTWVAVTVSPAGKYFSQDLVMYFDPETVNRPEIAQLLQTNVEKRVPTDIKDCKITIEKYYDDFRKKRPLEPNELSTLKNKVQACKNEFYKDWGGIFSGGNKMDEILDILSGLKAGGPSSYGEDSKWRLK
jgi:uncharacterized protein YktA (UPF0223 family)